MKARKTLPLALVLAFVLVVAATGVVAGLLMWRGFGAASEPSRMETVIARSMRNMAIPRRARDQRNPISSVAGDLRQGREDFLHRCASCHGDDGSGLTAVGQHLYPRVPDLRAPETQRLTDGELHYIVENGVKLTGMPAWGGGRAALGDAIWRLVLCVRSLSTQTKQEAEQARIAESARYTGSQACEKCHAEIYARWKRTPMANVVRDLRQHPDAIIPDLGTNTVAPFARDQVAFVYGSLWKQRYFTKIGDDYFPLPVQWEVSNHVWSRYVVPRGGDWWVPFYPEDNMKRPTGPTCDGCHSVGYDIHTKQVAEWNVGCERCHGRGSDQVANPTRLNILNPAHMDSVASTDTCIQCHSQGQPLANPIEGKYFDWPVGYQVGLELADSWRLEDHRLGEASFYYFADGTAHKNRMQGNDFVQSVMYRRGITCASCHDVHGTDNYAQLVKPADTICLDCHGPHSPNGPRAATLTEHTHHGDGVGSRCVDCHMPAIETEGPPNTYVHAHTFSFISPKMTDEYKIPNPCTSCHADRTTAWAIDELKGWAEVSPWRVGR